MGGRSLGVGRRVRTLDCLKGWLRRPASHSSSSAQYRANAGGSKTDRYWIGVGSCSTAEGGLVELLPELLLSSSDRKQSCPEDPGWIFESATRQMGRERVDG